MPSHTHLPTESLPEGKMLSAAWSIRPHSGGNFTLREARQICQVALKNPQRLRHVGRAALWQRRAVGHRPSIGSRAKPAEVYGQSPRKLGELKLRLLVRPELTGLAQVRTKPLETTQ
jgi:hypothetical protein